MAAIKEIGKGTISLELPEAKDAAKKPEFGNVLKHFIDGVEQLQQEANRAASEVATGKVENIHQAMVAMEKAEISFQLMLETRNRIVKAYEEIMKMQA